MLGREDGEVVISIAENEFVGFLALCAFTYLSMCCTGRVDARFEAQYHMTLAILVCHSDMRVHVSVV